MIDPDKMLKLRAIGAQNEENYLEIDPNLIVGWLGFNNATMIYTKIYTNTLANNTFSVQEDVPTLKEKIRELRGNS